MIHDVTAADLDEGTRNAITELHYRFGAALDTNDWDLYRSCLDDPITVHYEGAGLPRVRTAADDWTAFVKAAVEVQQTVHYFTNLMATRMPNGRVTCRLNHQSCHRVEQAWIWRFDTCSVRRLPNSCGGAQRPLVAHRDPPHRQLVGRQSRPRRHQSTRFPTRLRAVFTPADD